MFLVYYEKMFQLSKISVTQEHIVLIFALNGICTSCTRRIHHRRPANVYETYELLVTVHLYVNILRFNYK